MKSIKKIIIAVSALLILSPQLFAAPKIVFIEEDGIWSRPISDEEMCVSRYAPSPFSMNILGDSLIAGGTAAAWITSLVFKVNKTYPDFNGTLYDASQVPAIDRWAMTPYNKTLDVFGTVFEILDIAALPVVTYGLEFLFKNLPAYDGITVSLMYAESLMAVQAIKNFMKIFILRVRPYMYFEGYNTRAIKYHDFEFSMPSGHTMNTFMSAAFMTYTFCKYYPRSAWKIPVIATSYGLALTTAIFRMTGGSHFFTDVLTGAAIGTAIGLGIPFVHTLFTNISKATEANGKSLSIQALPTGLQVKFFL